MVIFCPVIEVEIVFIKNVALLFLGKLVFETLVK
jgi:hypothetical protein